MFLQVVLGMTYVIYNKTSQSGPRKHMKLYLLNSFQKARKSKSPKASLTTFSSTRLIIYEYIYTYTHIYICVCV